MENSPSSHPSKSSSLATAALAGILGVGLVGYNIYDNHIDNRKQADLHKLVDDQRRDYSALLQRVNMLDNELTVDELHDIIEKTQCSLVAIGPLENPASGFFMDDCHFIVTNHHVTDGLTKGGIAQNGQFPITLHAHNRADEPFTFFATLEAESSYLGGSDLAILRVPEEVRTQLPTWVQSVQLRDTGKRPMNSGEVAIAVGNPIALRSSVTVGRVSQGERHLDFGEFGPNPLYPTVQIDAENNRGSSGGLLVDSEGELMGVPSLGFGPGLNHARHVLNLKAILEEQGLPVSISPQERIILDRWAREYAAMVARQQIQPNNIDSGPNDE